MYSRFCIFLKKSGVQNPEKVHFKLNYMALQDTFWNLQIHWKIQIFPSSKHSSAYYGKRYQYQVPKPRGKDTV